jgi:peptide deformylase
MVSLEKQYPLQYGRDNPILRSVAQPVDFITDDIRKFASILQDLLWVYEGVWLAAPQVGKSLRIIASTQRRKVDKKDELLSELVMINPEIISRSDDLQVSEEACLSLPGEHGVVRRYRSVTVRYQSVDDKIYEQEFQGFNAAIIQHEIDHLDGVLFIDKLVR